MPPFGNKERREPRLSAAPGAPQKSWTSQEVWIWERVLAGEVADLNRLYGAAEPLDPRTDDAAWRGPAKPRRLSERFLLDVHTVPDFAAAVPHHGVRIVGAWFPEPLDLSDIVFRHQLWLDRCRFDGKVSFRTVRLESHLSLEGSTFKDEVDLLGAKVGGAFVASGATFEGRLDMDSLAVGQGSFLREGATFEGEVDLVGAKVEGQVSAIGATFGDRLVLDGLVVGQSLFLGRRTIFKGEVSLRSARVEGQLDLSCTAFEGHLDMNGLVVGQGLLLRGGVFKGEVDLSVAKIGGHLDASGAAFHRALDASATVIEGELRLGSSHHPRTRWESGASLVLRNTSVGALQDRIDPGPGSKLLDAWPERLQLDGFTYRRLGGLTASVLATSGPWPGRGCSPCSARSCSGSAAPRRGWKGSTGASRSISTRSCPWSS